VAVGLPDQSGEDGQVVTIPTASAFSDIDGDTLSFSAVGLPPGLAIDSFGNITGTIDPSASQGGPASDGVYQVTVTADDGNGGVVSTVFIYSVQDVAPIAQDDTATTAEDTSVTVAVLANDSDPDGDPLTITSASADNGTVVINADGTLTFTPNANFNGEANVTYEISDGEGGVATATLTVTVTPVNDDPIATSIPNVTNEDSQSVSIATDSF
ncbi:Ig-like domain-containing protein, partial [Erythrobacter ani]